MADRTCDVAECFKPVKARGWCKLHYSRYQRNGTIELRSKVQPIEPRFWTKVDQSGTCWLWTGARLPKGYGIFKINRRNVYAHRYSYGLHNGPIPDGLMVMHSCDNPPCVNPAHLTIGTAQDNLSDMAAKGRGVTAATRARGERHASAKLTETDVLAIRSDPRSQDAIASEYGVGQSAISRILLRKTWTHI